MFYSKNLLLEFEMIFILLNIRCVFVLGNFGFMFLLAVVSLMAGSGSAGPMSSSYGYAPTTTITYAPAYYKAPVYTTQAPYTTTTYAAPSYYVTEKQKWVEMLVI